MTALATPAIAPPPSVGMPPPASGAAPARARPGPRLLPTITAPVQPAADAGKTGKGYSWSADELRVLRERYPYGGVLACLPFLPARNEPAVRAKASKLGLRYLSGYRQQPPSTDALDAAIRQLYAAGLIKPGAMAAFVRRHGRPRQWVRSRAIQLGVAPARAARHWTPAEDALLARHEGRGARYMQKALIAAGITDRTEPAIAERCRKLALDARKDRGDDYTCNAAAAALGLDSHVILRWITAGRLPAQRIPPANGGAGHSWRIRHRDLRDFMIRYPLDWYPGRCDRSWLVETLAGRIGGEPRGRGVAP
jgi:hypothetical protein